MRAPAWAGGDASGGLHRDPGAGRLAESEQHEGGGRRQRAHTQAALEVQGPGHEEQAAHQTGHQLCGQATGELPDPEEGQGLVTLQPLQGSASTCGRAATVLAMKSSRLRLPGRRLVGPDGPSLRGGRCF